MRGDGVKADKRRNAPGISRHRSRFGTPFRCDAGIIAHSPSRSRVSRMNGLNSRLGILILVSLMALATHLLPLIISPLPYNNDGLTECRIAEDIIETGNLSYDPDANYYTTHSPATPAYNIMIAFVGAVIGESPLGVAQLIVAMISVLTVVGGYTIALTLFRDLRPALVCALFLALYGTLLFHTGSAWKGALGFGLLVFLFFLYAHRKDLATRATLMLTLMVLPLVHHLAMAIGFFSMISLTLLSCSHWGRMSPEDRRQVVIDLSAYSCLALFGLLYYEFGFLDRLDFAFTEANLAILAISFALLLGVAVVFLRMERHSKITFAPIPGVLLFTLLATEYQNPFFGYSSEPFGDYIILAASVSVLVSFSWYGLENVIESKIRLRHLPIGILLPVATLLLFALFVGFSLRTHNIIYRSFDYADLALALGVAGCIFAVRERKKIAFAVVACVIAALLITFPFGYFSEGLLGIRHDTQEYETDALEWIGGNTNSSWSLLTDERLSYVASALYDFEKIPYLPDSLRLQGRLPVENVYLYEEQWAVIGVNDYPRGYVVVDSQWIETVLDSSDVYYVGGPTDNNALVFSSSLIGWDELIG